MSRIQVEEYPSTKVIYSFNSPQNRDVMMTTVITETTNDLNLEITLKAPDAVRTLNESSVEGFMQISMQMITQITESFFSLTCRARRRPGESEGLSGAMSKQ